MKKFSKVIGLILIIILFCFPLITPSTFAIYLLTQILIVGIFAIGYDLLLGYTGMLSFGHAGFFGIGAYVSAFFLEKYSFSLSTSLLGAVIITLAVSFIVGYICIQVSGIYFSMLTLVFGQLIYECAMKFVSITGGIDGIVGVPRSQFLFINMAKDIYFYYLTLVLIIACYLIARMLTLSPFGQTLQAIRANEQRTSLVGFNTQRFKLLIFAISGIYAGLAGALFPPFMSSVGPILSHWSTSGNVVMMTLVGGKGSLIGPVLGSAFIYALKDLIGSHTEYWMLILGIVFVIFVLLVPEGILGLLRSVVIRKR